jgi:exodeoxyribonuclease VII large subunit
MSTNFRLSELNLMVKESLQTSFPETVWVMAEISEMKVNRNGHCYLELIDKDPQSNEVSAKARATIWSWQFRFIQPYFETITGQLFTSGIKVLVSATVEFHELYGYSLNIKDIDPTYTLGDIAKKRAEIINRLTEEGVIDMNRELAIPEIPSRIAIISSPTAAGYEDFIDQLLNNNYGFKFYTKLFAANMQGNDAASSIIAALDQIFEKEDLFDVVVLIRGGGSQHDLSCFDDYDLALHISQFPLPVITGIGHEKDQSIADMVAHTRMKTPTAVAEFILSIFEDRESELYELQQKIHRLTNYIIDNESRKVNEYIKYVKPIIEWKLGQAKNTLNKLKNKTQTTIKDNAHLNDRYLAKLKNVLNIGLHNTLKKNENIISAYQSKIAVKGKISLINENHVIELKKQRLVKVFERIFDKHQSRLVFAEKNLQLVDPKNILDRGFSITFHEGKVVKNSATLCEGSTIETIYSEGKTVSVVNKQR